VIVQRRYSAGTLTPYPKTQRRRVPLTPRALAAVDAVPPRLDTKLLFPASRGRPHPPRQLAHPGLVPGARGRRRRPRGPYHLRHTFATEALAAGVSIFQLSRLMGASVKTIDRTYGHLAHDSEDHLRDLLAARSGAPGLVELRIVERAQIDGRVLYAVTRGGWVATRDREWELEPIPSSRDAAFLARARWESWEDAALVAQYMADTPSAWDSRTLA
jgi:hypothetical protein